MGDGARQARRLRRNTQQPIAPVIPERGGTRLGACARPRALTPALGRLDFGCSYRRLKEAGDAPNCSAATRSQTVDRRTLSVSKNGTSVRRLLGSRCCEDGRAARH